jgi:hypothetical protein
LLLSRYVPASVVVNKDHADFAFQRAHIQLPAAIVWQGQPAFA